MTEDQLIVPGSGIIRFYEQFIWLSFQYLRQYVFKIWIYLLSRKNVKLNCVILLHVKTWKTIKHPCKKVDTNCDQVDTKWRSAMISSKKNKSTISVYVFMCFVVEYNLSRVLLLNLQSPAMKLCHEIYAYAS